MLEKQVQDQIFEYIVRTGGLAIRINSGAMSKDKDTPNKKTRFIRFVTWQAVGFVKTMAGVSDILACINGRFVAIEVKAPGKIDNVSDKQADFLETVRRCGGLAIVADSLDIVIEASLQ